MKYRLSAPRPSKAIALFTATLFAGMGITIARAQDAPVVAEAPPQNPPQTPKVGDIAPDFVLQGLKGEPVQLSALTQQGPVVLVMLRGYPGYQCPLCTAQVGQLLNKAEEFSQANTRVSLVYPGPAEGLKAHADEFVRGKDMPANFYLALDPDFKFTHLYNLRWDAPNETAYPSTFVLDAKRKVLFAKISHSHGDRAKVEDVVAALPK